MASVFLAEDTVLRRRVAIKRLAIDTPEASAARFRREAKIGASLNHRNLVSIYDTFESDDGLFIVMEYVEGEHLGQAMARGRMETSRAVDMLRAVASGLDHAHRAGVVHRDVKPANILLGHGEVVKVADLGIAVRDERMTTEGAVLGTLSYLAPELLSGAEVTPAVDTYSLAVVAWEALSGQKVRAADNPLAIANMAVNEPAPDIREAWPEAPEALADALGEGMCRDPDGRPGSPGELMRRVDRALAAPAGTLTSPQPQRAETAPTPAPAEPRPPAPRPPAPVAGPPRSRRSRVAAAVLLALGAVAALLVLLSSSGSDSKRTPRVSSTRTPASAKAASTTPTSPATPAAAAAGRTHTAPGEPAATVRAFYNALVDRNFDKARALLDPSAAAQLGSTGVSGLASTLRSVTFARATTSARSSSQATVSIVTTAVHTDHTDHCTGTVQMSGAPGAWKLHRFGVAC
jgi:serine/threonine-protein kinase